MVKSKFTPEQKIHIVLESIRTSISTAELCCKHNVRPQTFHNWKQRFMESGKAGLSQSGKKDPIKTMKKREDGKIKTACFSLYTPDLNPGGATEAVQKIYLELPVPKYQWGAKVHTRDAKEKRDSDCKNERVFASLTPHLVITWN